MIFDYQEFPFSGRQQKIAVSLDSYIATFDGGVEWLHQFQISENEDYEYKELYQSIN